MNGFTINIISDGVNVYSTSTPRYDPNNVIDVDYVELEDIKQSEHNGSLDNTIKVLPLPNDVN